MHEVSADEVKPTVSSDYVAGLGYSMRLTDRSASHGAGARRQVKSTILLNAGTISPREAARPICSKAVVWLLLMALKSEKKPEKVQVSSDRQGIPICRE